MQTETQDSILDTPPRNYTPHQKYQVVSRLAKKDITALRRQQGTIDLMITAAQHINKDDAIQNLLVLQHCVDQVILSKTSAD